jgi:hypothetical protein
MMRRSTIFLVILGVSLAANVFAAGFLLKRWPEGRGSRMERFALAAAIGHAPSGLRDRVAAEVEAARPSIDAAFDEFMAARRNVRAAMRAEPLDAAALDKAFADLRSRSDAFQAAIHRAVGRAVASAPPEVRAEIRNRKGEE